MKEKFQDRKWVLRILAALGVLVIVMGVSLYLHGIDPFSSEALDLVGQSVETVLSDSGHKMADVSLITSEESAAAVAGESGTTAAGGSGSTANKKVEKKEEKEEKKTQQAVQEANSTIQSDMNRLIEVVASWLPAWIPYRVFVVWMIFLGVLIALILLLNRYF